MDYQHGGSGPVVSRSAANAELARLCEAYLSDPENADVREKFLKRCVTLLKKKVDYYAVYRRKCPRFLAPGTFAEDAFSLALVKFSAGIGSLRNPAELSAWLSKVASSAVYDELRQFTRRTNDGPCEWETIETMRFSEDGNILDEEMNRQPAKDGHTFNYVADLKDLMHRDILEKVFNGSGNRSKDEDRDWLVLKLSMVFEVDEIAEQLGMEKPKVRYQLKKSKQRFRIIAKRRYKIHKL